MGQCIKQTVYRDVADGTMNIRIKDVIDCAKSVK